MRYKVNAKDIRVLDVYTSLSRRFFGRDFFFVWLNVIPYLFKTGGLFFFTYVRYTLFKRFLLPYHTYSSPTLPYH